LRLQLHIPGGGTAGAASQRTHHVYRCRINDRPNRAELVRVAHRPLVDLYREAGRRAGHPPEQLRVGVHALGYLAPTMKQAIDEFAPGYVQGLTKAGRERGWGPATRDHFDAELGPRGTLIVGGPDEVVAKIRHYDDVVGGVTRLTFQMDLAALPHATLMRSIEILGTRVAPALQGQTL
jgi:alkanesulfonate monooxygenase SsuD/methylene tetrahydromethanopterin reductase-like flavin-dependent oxidoreductase (luciferase family)